MKVSNEFKIGVFVAVVLCLVYMGITVLKGTDLFSFNQKRYSVVYDKGGSKVGDGVYIKGIWVGSIIKTKFIKESLKLKIYFKIKNGIVLTDKCIATLNGPGLMPGRNCIKIVFTEPGGEPLKSGSELRGAISRLLLTKL